MSINRLLIVTFLCIGGLVLMACTPPAETVSVTRPSVQTISTATSTSPISPTITPTQRIFQPTATMVDTAVRPIEPITQATATSRPPQPLNPTSEAPAAISAEELALRMENGLPFTAVSAIEGYPLYQLSGFEYGFRHPYYCEFGPYRWLTNEQLMLFPIVSNTTWFEEPTGGSVTQPIIFNLADGTSWSPNIPRTDVCHLPAWSNARQQIIEASNGEVRLRDLSGNLIDRYPGTLPLFVAPSGQRLIAGNHWIDLEAGEVISLDGWQRVKFPRPAWGADETEIFECCFSYANITNDLPWTQAEFTGMWISGIGVGPGHIGSESRWLADGTIMIQPSGIRFQTDGQNSSLIPLIDPINQSYVNILEQLQLPDSAIDCGTFIAPSNEHLWLTCAELIGTEYNPYFETSYLMTLPTLEATAVNGTLIFKGWSANSRYLAYTNLTDPPANLGSTWLMSSLGEQRSVSEQPADFAKWHPTQPSVAFLYSSNQQFHFVQAETGQTRWLDFPHTISDLAWQPNGDGVAILTADGAIYWLADAFDSTSKLVQASSPLPNVQAMRWSPNGRKIAFISDSGLYIVKIPASAE